MEKILVIKHGALGDLVLELGTFGAVKRENREAQMWIVTTKGMVPLVRATGVFSGYIVDNRGGMKETLTVLRSIAGGGFSKIYNFQASQRVRMYRFMLRRMLPPGEYRWYEVYENNILTLTKKNRRGIGSVRRTPTRVPRTLTDLSQMAAEGKHFDLLPREPYVLLIPGCSAKNAYKRWDARNFCEIANRLGKAGVHVVVLGSVDDAAECNTIARGRDWVVNMVGMTALTDIPQVALRSIAVLGNDTGPTHIAAMTGRYTIGLFDHRNANSYLQGAHCDSIVSPGNVNCIPVDEVWKKLSANMTNDSSKQANEK